MKKFELNDYIQEPKGKVAKRVIFKDDNVITFILNIAKRQSLPRHTHFGSTVLIKVIQGSANLNYDDKSIGISQDNLVQLDGPEEMSVDNLGEKTLVLYVTISPAPSDDKFTTDVDL
ncbi:cupin domain-containing protein [Natranaerobius thermophilus]|uniref:Cupin 2 conserved barrel domain protein n=1 Tax=Natranaerobius thermophilus (strain ATCC BAA-1301 / DSM 18059 / JW/NM-WN-LF) TaxID=457570 RepID=B2A0J5_NATTJ|nr:cupin [Natranaerobius thermophilus]ACB84556.1 conserved hypothetical protein [Natranaerobius thermophilus JW/NM-WN-LF]